MQAQKFFNTIRNKADPSEVYKKYGNFIWNIYDVMQKQFTEIKASNITRLMFVATYVGYDGYLLNSQGTPLTKSNMATLLGLSDREFRNFWDEMSSCNILTEKESGIYLDKKVFLRGHVPQSKIRKLAKNNKHITRLYIHGIRDLYKKSTIRSHKTLSYMFQILPFVNREYNIVCHNPLETDLELVEAMTLGEFCDIIGYEKNNATRLFNFLFEPTFAIDKKMKTAMRYVVDRSMDKKTYKMFINPRVYYAGTHWEKVEVLGEF